MQEYDLKKRPGHTKNGNDQVLVRLTSNQLNEAAFTIVSENTYKRVEKEQTQQQLKDDTY